MGQRAGEGGPRGQEEQWQNGWPEWAQPEGSREEGFVEGWANLGDEDQRQDRMATGCSKVTSKDTVGARFRNGEAKELNRPYSTSQRQCQGLWGLW